MIFPELRVPIPDIGGFTISRGNVKYCYVYVGDRVPSGKDGKTMHPKSRCIGRIETSEDGQSELMPNTAYYELTGQALPELAVTEGAGRKPRRRKPENSAEMKPDSEIAMGYGIAIMLLSAELELTGALLKAFGDTLGKRILCLAAFLCEDMRSSFDGLDEFIAARLSGTDFGVAFDRLEAGQALADITPEKAGEFYTLWNKAHPAEKEIFYDVTSFSAYSGNIIRAHYGYNRDHDDLPQINQGLFCDRETGLPLFMCSYDGSLNDKSNFNNALKRAQEHGAGIGRDRRKICIVTDGGFSSADADWSHYAGYDVIIGVSADCRKDVREAYKVWTKGLTESARADSWEMDESCYISAAIPFRLGNLDGELMMYRDLHLEYDKRKQLSRIRDSKRRELDETPAAPEDNFQKWAESFAPYFKVSKDLGRKGFIYEEDKEAFREKCALCGKVTIFARRNHIKITPRETLKIYRSKESAEDCFDTAENGLSDKRLHVPGDRQRDGKLFVMFVALILKRVFTRRIEQYLKENSLSAAIKELEGIKFYKAKRGAKDGWRLKDSITQTQREILEHLDLKHLNLKLREDAQFNTNKLKQRVRKGRQTKLSVPASEAP